MQKLLINTKKADFKQGKFIEEKVGAVVASTKSQNKLIDEMKEQGFIVGKVVVEEIFLDKAITAKAVAEMVNSQIEDKEVAKAVAAHVVKALDGACVFKK